MARKRATTAAQRTMLARLWVRTNQGLWLRADCHGARVTLASLHYRGLAVRRVWAGEGTASPAHEYQLAPALLEAMRQRRLVQAVDAHTTGQEAPCHTTTTTN